MLTNKTRAKIAKLSAKPITDRLSLQAYEQIVENFCLPRCGHTPDGELCSDAERTHRLLVTPLFGTCSGLN